MNGTVQYIPLFVCEIIHIYGQKFCLYATVEKLVVSKIFFWKKSLLLTKAAFIWSKIQQKLWNIITI